MSSVQHPKNALHYAKVFTELVSQPFRYHVYLSRTHAVALNLSIEQYLFQKTHPNSTVLFLYVNEPCVVIGRNQNPWLEFNHDLARRGVAIGGLYSSENKVDVIRRRSGGGTVFHDLGNVNFSVIYPQKTFYRDKYAEMMVRAIRKTNPRARVNERHDIVLDQGTLVEEEDRPDPNDTHRTSFGSSEFRKVSGSAYKLARGRALHHGTCLLSSPNLPSISDYLRSPAAAFMKAQGVESVRSPIANIIDQSEVKSGPDTSAFQHQIVEAFVQIHGLNMHELSPSVRNTSGSGTLEGNGQIASGILDARLLEIDEITGMEEEIQVFLDPIRVALACCCQITDLREVSHTPIRPDTTVHIVEPYYRGRQPFSTAVANMVSSFCMLFCQIFPSNDCCGS